MKRLLWFCFSLSASACGGAASSAQPSALASSPGAAQPVAAVQAQPPQPVATQAQSGPQPSEAGRKGWLGVELAKRGPGEAGVLVKNVMHGSPAERAGLSSGDVVVSFDAANVSTPSELRAHVVATAAGTRVSLGVLRGTATRLFAVDLEEMPDDDEAMRRKYVDSPAPDLGSLDTVQGNINPTLAALRGRVVVLEFWASWCGVCHVMAPTLNGWNDRYSAQGLTVLGVTNDPVDVAGRTATELSMGYPLASDTTGNVLRTYSAFALPTLFVIDKHGTVRDVLIGYSTPRLREIEALVRKLIAEG